MFDHHRKRTEWIRLLQWEALETGEGPLAAEEQRRAHLSRACGDVEKAQRSGWLPQGPEAPFMIMAFMAMMVFPFAFPQMVRLITGLSPHDPNFRARYIAAVRALVVGGS